MGELVNGVWQSGPVTKNEGDGVFRRRDTVYRDFIRADGSSDFRPEAGRYHLYVAHACPWANRTLIMRQLKGLEGAIGVSFVAPYMGEDGWVFDEDHHDDLFGKRFLREVYVESSDNYTGKVTVPVLWDRKLSRIVNNESREIIRMLDHELDAIAEKPIDYAPPELSDEVEAALDAIYEPVNNGVYRSGFASTQEAYEGAVTELFDALDHWEGVLAERRYLCGDQLTEADICMFTTLIRFDLVYHGHFKCNLRRISEYPNLYAYVCDLYQTPGFAETIDFQKIKEHYYWSHESINPSRIVPKGPVLDFTGPHGREALTRN